jgi:hypothetical protein
MTIQSHWTNDNYRTNFERIFSKKSEDAKSEDAKSEDAKSEDALSATIESETLTCVVRFTAEPWQNVEPSLRVRMWLPFETKAANIHRSHSGSYFWSAHRPDGLLLEKGFASSSSDAARSADNVLRDFCAKNQGASQEASKP